MTVKSGVQDMSTEKPCVAGRSKLNTTLQWKKRPEGGCVGAPSRRVAAEYGLTDREYVVIRLKHTWEESQRQSYQDGLAEWKAERAEWEGNPFAPIKPRPWWYSWDMFIPNWSTYYPHDRCDTAAGAKARAQQDLDRHIAHVVEQRRLIAKAVAAHTRSTGAAPVGEATVRHYDPDGHEGPWVLLADDVVYRVASNGARRRAKPWVKVTAHD